MNSTATSRVRFDDDDVEPGHVGNQREESSISLICPTDRTSLERGSGVLSCPSCHRSYQVDDRLVIFLDHSDSFYEGAFNNQVKFIPARNGFWHALPLWLITNGFMWQVRKYLKPGACILELGCAGGVAWFGKQFRMIGVDLSHMGLRLAAQKYELCLQADNLSAIPDNSLDGVISSYFWEHVAADRKTVLLDDIRRVLKPGGHVIFLYDVATKNPLIRRLARISPELYQVLFIDADGHLGYQTVDENDALFRAHGFKIICSKPMERSPFQSTSVYIKMQQWPGMARMVGRILAFLDKQPFLHPYQGLLRVIDETVGRLLPRNWGRITITVAVKPQGGASNWETAASRKLQ